MEAYRRSIKIAIFSIIQSTTTHLHTHLKERQEDEPVYRHHYRFYDHLLLHCLATQSKM